MPCTCEKIGMVEESRDVANVCYTATNRAKQEDYMNSVTLIGRLTKDPELRYTSGNNQTAVARFTLAVDDGYGENKRTSFIPIVVFGKQAENCEKYLTKGSQAGITGRIQTGSYEKDGRKVYTTDVIATRVEFLGSRTQRNEKQNAEVFISEFESIEEDIPF